MAPDDLNSTSEDMDLESAIGAAEELAGAVDNGGVDLEQVLASDSDAVVGDSNGPARYDFNRPNSISRTFEKNLQAVGEAFAKMATIDFTSLMRSTTKVEFTGLRQNSFGDFQGAMPKPTCAALVTLEPLKGMSLIHLDLSLCYIFMQKLLGGALSDAAPEREFTEIERGINAGLVERFAEILRKATSKWTELKPAFVKLENNPGYLSGIAEGESLIILGFRVQVGPADGRVEMAIPLSAFGPVREVFDPQETIELRTAYELKDDRRRILNMVQGTDGEVVVELGSYGSNLEEILNLTEGDVLRLPQAVETPLKVKVAGRDAWLGEAGRVGQNRAVKLIQQLTKE
ncbi:MAG: hypothetical protein GY838_07055 [bacterium]|nr:hypothetical protein [bacterium]